MGAGFAVGDDVIQLMIMSSRVVDLLASVRTEAVSLLQLLRMWLLNMEGA
jgi:hypothetical protein